MEDAAALLADQESPDAPRRQWIARFPTPLRYLFSAQVQAMAKVLGVVFDAISTHPIYKIWIAILSKTLMSYPRFKILDRSISCLIAVSVPRRQLYG
jgi:hypothetical protein